MSCVPPVFRMYGLSCLCIFSLLGRHTIRGIHELFFYQLPHFGDFYPQMVNMLMLDAPRGEKRCVRTLFSRCDKYQLDQVVGTRRGREMRTASRPVTDFNPWLWGACCHLCAAGRRKHRSPCSSLHLSCLHCCRHCLDTTCKIISEHIDLLRVYIARVCMALCMCFKSHSLYWAPLWPIICLVHACWAPVCFFQTDLWPLYTL